MQRFTTSMLALLWGAIATTPAAAGTFSVLYSFQGGADASQPNRLIAVGTTLYGTTLLGGSGGNGTLFSFDPVHKNEAVLHAFPAAQGDGETPVDGLLNLGGTLYGTTSSGGSLGAGVVFSFDITQGTETVVHSLTAKQGRTPEAGLTQYGRNLFGTATTSGAYDNGSIYRLNPTTKHFAVIHSFAGKDGSTPTYALLRANNMLYGTTTSGGAGAKSKGVVFSINPRSGNYKVIYTFRGGSDGSTPNGSLTFVNGALYGETLFAGSSSCNSGGGCGTVFKVDPSTGVETTLHLFQGGTDGAYPQGGLVSIGTKLYGVTSNGGAGCNGHGCGTVFSVDIDTGATTIEHALDYATDGYWPSNQLLYVNGTLYGGATLGGPTGNGTLFSYKP